MASNIDGKTSEGDLGCRESNISVAVRDFIHGIFQELSHSINLMRTQE